MKNLFLLGILYVLVLGSVSCREDIVFEPSVKELRFSKDTLFLDTLYHKVGSEVYLVKVFNDENKDILIPKIELKGGNQSIYSINIDGSSGTKFSNIPLRKKDSLYIFVQATPIAHNREAIVEDKIIFGNNNQHITLLSVIQDADFFIQNEKNKNTITENTVWNNDKAKIILGDLTIAQGVTLDIKKGTKIYFAKNSALKLSKNARLNAMGDLGEEIIFRGERNDSRYDTIAMNWRGIIAEEGSTVNLNYTKLFGGRVGLELQKATANIHNTHIHTFQNYGIQAFASVINADNLVMNQCGQATLGIFRGGHVELVHSTLANYQKQTGTDPTYSIYLSNEQKETTHLSVKNSILYNNNNAIKFDSEQGAQLNYYFENSLIKFEPNAGYQWDKNSFIVNCIKNEDPQFINTFISKMNLGLKNNSPAKGKGNPNISQKVPLDIRKISRIHHPNMGAYQ